MQKQPPVDVLQRTVASEEEVANKMAQFLATPAGVNLLAQRNKGVLDDVAYEQQRSRLFSEFLTKLDSSKAA